MSLVFHTNKKGISPVIANVLIILLVIATVAIVWAVVRPSIEGTGEQITTRTDCLSINFEVLSCNASANADPAIVVRRNAGGSGIISGYRITTPDGVINSWGALEVLGISKLDASYVNGNQGVTLIVGDEVNVGGILEGGQVCEPQNEPVTCTN